MNKEILENIKKLKRDIMPNEKVYLFGSQARGDNKSNSDCDLLIILNKDRKEFSDYDNYGYPYTDLGWKFGKYISPKIFTKADWEKQKTSLFYRNVGKDSIEI